MKKMNHVLVGMLALSAFSFPSFAGNEGSGGGNAVVCFDSPEVVSQIKRSKINGGGYIEDKHISHITSVELLDVHKARLATINEDGGLVYPRIIESRAEETSKEYTNRILKRFDGLFDLPRLLESLKLPTKAFPNGLAPIDDVDAGEVYSSNCVRSTIIAQYTEANRTYAAIDARIYALPGSIFPASSRGLSFWHESFYYVARRTKNVKSSDAVQSLIAAMITEDVTFGEVVRKLESAIGFPTYLDRNGFLYFSVLMEDFYDELKRKNLTKVFAFSKSYSRETDEKVIRKELLKNFSPVVEQIKEVYLKQFQAQVYAMKIPHALKAKLDNALTKYVIFKNSNVLNCSVNFLKTCELQIEFNGNLDLYSQSEYSEEEKFDVWSMKIPNE